MKKILGILICMIGISAFAVEYESAKINAQAPAVNMQSVNNASYMSAGSVYSPAIQEVGASTPSSAPAKGPQKAPSDPSGKSNYDPNNPQFSPVGDALLPLSLMALAFAGVIYLRKRKIAHGDAQHK